MSVTPGAADWRAATRMGWRRNSGKPSEIEVVRGSDTPRQRAESRGWLSVRRRSGITSVA